MIAKGSLSSNPSPYPNPNPNPNSEVNLEVQVKLDARFNVEKWCEILGGSSNDRVCPGPKDGLGQGRSGI